MRFDRRPTPGSAFAAALLLSLALSLVVRAQDAPPTADDVKAKVAALELDAAKDLLARFKSGAKSAEEKSAAKELEKELAIARKVEPVAKKQVPKLAADGRPRDAYALAMATADQFPGALALPALCATAREARDAAFHVIDDFDKTAIPSGKVHAGGPATKPARVFEVDVTNSTIEVVLDPMGGKALRWEWKQLASGDFAGIGWYWKTELDLEAFEYATIRYRTAQGLAKALNVQIASAPRDQEHRLKFSATAARTPGWRELRVPFDKAEKRVDFDPKKTIGVSLSTFSPGPVEIYIDEVLLARKTR